MKTKLKLNRNQMQALCLMLYNILNAEGRIYDPVTDKALLETIWNLYIKIGRRSPSLKQRGNSLTLSATESWALWIGFKYVTSANPYDLQLINYISGIIHQKSL